MSDLSQIPTDELLKMLQAHQAAPTPQQTGGQYTMPANAGLANFAANIAGLPMETVKNAANLGIAGYGALKGAFGGTPPDLIKHVPGDVENVKGMLRSTGMPGLSPDLPAGTGQPNLNPLNPATQYAFMSRGGFIPGGAIAAGGSIAGEALGGPQWAGVGALAPAAVTQAYNAARAPSLEGAKARNAVRTDTAEQGREAGLVAPPSQYRQGGLTGWLTRRLESVGGKAALEQESMIRNQDVVDAAARKALGLPENTPLSDGTFNKALSQASEPYQKIAAISPEAATELHNWKDANFRAGMNRKFYYSSGGNPQAYDAWQGYKAKAEQALDNLEHIATWRQQFSARPTQGPELIDELRAARVQIAKIHQIEDATNVGTGSVAARPFGAALSKDELVPPEMLPIAKFQQAFPRAMRSGDTSPTPGVSALEPLSEAALGAAGYGMAGGAKGLVGAGLPLLRGPARMLLMSGPYQNASIPSYAPFLQNPSREQLLARVLLSQQQQGQ